jgi:hypothetical protein
MELYIDHEPQNPTEHTTTIKGFIGYQSTNFTFGLEQFRQSLTIQKADNIIRTGTSFFAKMPISENTVAFFRTDLYNPNAGNDYYKETFFLAGADFRLGQNISLIPNIWVNNYHTENSKIIERKSDVVGRVTFFFRVH